MRNADVHGHDQHTRAIQRDRVLSKRLQEIYQQKFQMEPRVQDLLYDTIEEHSRQSFLGLINRVSLIDVKVLTTKEVKQQRDATR